ncbi:uncharacterized protein BDCG_16508 [Blastomyces dermatitidis ER-3]|uniref:Uncharacterized protein n=2 Tax=Ajellomyces dermatitidis TaxID=5039 RepID=A0A0J9EPI8_AJEDA|nr:uncharacterized protein BDCG_16508 [Blastomyces dermatitidis ER-3]KMW67125.1 hypothetical protein BDDG_11926 [Blastomyces dermatitidis ATCC 18188]OAT00200.1 hypothetical protein BDCG_16508 [Blastomyces dermatitidis ER-3]
MCCTHMRGARVWNNTIANAQSIKLRLESVAQFCRGKGIAITERNPDRSVKGDKAA